MSARMMRMAALIIPAVFAAGCATSYPGNYGLDADNAVTVRQSCRDIMGLTAGPEFVACTGSLAETVLALQEVDVLMQADQSCAQQGHAAGTPELAQCIVMFRREAAERASPASFDAGKANVAMSAQPFTGNASSGLKESLPRKYYFHMDQAERDVRAELSCAQLGLHPAWGSFRQCVFNLQRAIVEVRDATPHY